MFLGKVLFWKLSVVERIVGSSLSSACNYVLGLLLQNPRLSSIKWGIQVAYFQIPFQLKKLISLYFGSPLKNFTVFFLIFTWEYVSTDFCRERERWGEREILREIEIEIGCLPYASWLGVEPVTFWCAGNTPTNWATRPGLTLEEFLKIRTYLHITNMHVS